MVDITIKIPDDPDKSKIETELVRCKLEGCETLVDPKVRDFCSDEHRTKHNNERRRKTPRKKKAA